MRQPDGQGGVDVVQWPLAGEGDFLAWNVWHIGPFPGELGRKHQVHAPVGDLLQGDLVPWATKTYSWLSLTRGSQATPSQAATTSIPAGIVDPISAKSAHVCGLDSFYRGTFELDGNFGGL
jgi:hypothetical protein